MTDDGHPYDEANTWWYHGFRVCRTCRNARQRGQRLRRQQRAAA